MRAISVHASSTQVFIDLREDFIEQTYQIYVALDAVTQGNGSEAKRWQILLIMFSLCLFYFDSSEFSIFPR